MATSRFFDWDGNGKVSFWEGLGNVVTGGAGGAVAAGASAVTEKKKEEGRKERGENAKPGKAQNRGLRNTTIAMPKVRPGDIRRGMPRVNEGKLEAKGMLEDLEKVRDHAKATDEALEAVVDDVKEAKEVAADALDEATTASANVALLHDSLQLCGYLPGDKEHTHPGVFFIDGPHPVRISFFELLAEMHLFRHGIGQTAPANLAATGTLTLQSVVPGFGQALGQELVRAVKVKRLAVGESISVRKRDVILIEAATLVSVAGPVASTYSTDTAGNGAFGAGANSVLISLPIGDENTCRNSDGSACTETITDGETWVKIENKTTARGTLVVTFVENGYIQPYFDVMGVLAYLAIRYGESRGVFGALLGQVFATVMGANNGTQPAFMAAVAKGLTFNP